jgi:subtilase family serine protease
VDVAAPDSNVVYYDGKAWFVRGTSASAAFTSGMAAGIADSTRKSWSDVQAIILKNFAVPPSNKK